jgi:hypothetical protein
MKRETKMSSYEIRREVSHGISYRGAMMGRQVKRVRYVVYRDGAQFCQFTTRSAAENCVLMCEKDNV